MRPSSHCSIAFSGEGRSWYLIGATPDVHRQIQSTKALWPGPGIRETPIRGVLLTSAELDHVIGLLVLREGSPLEVYGASPVLSALESDFPVRRVLQPYVGHRWIQVCPGESFFLEEARLEVTPVRLGSKRPRYATGPDEGDWVIGYSVRDAHRGSAFFFAPSVEAWSAELEHHLTRSDCAFIDGTFWSGDEMEKAVPRSQASAISGHLPIDGDSGTATRFAASGLGKKFYVHVNNTNPIFSDRSSEFARLARLGIDIGRDGLALEI